MFCANFSNLNLLFPKIFFACCTNENIGNEKTSVILNFVITFPHNQIISTLFVVDVLE